MLRAVAQGVRFGKVEEVLFDWADSPLRLTRSDSRYDPAAFDRCRQMYLFSGPLKDIDQIDLWGVGRTGKSWLHRIQAHGISV